jgi:hypothetical protein
MPYSLARQCVQQDTMSDRMGGVEVWIFGGAKILIST